MAVTKYFEVSDGVALGDSIVIKDDAGKATFSDIEITTPKTLKQLLAKNFSVKIISESESLEILEAEQMIVYGLVRVDGTVELTGELVLI